MGRRTLSLKQTWCKSALVVNDTLTLAGIPRQAFGDRLGNRSALKWFVDQYGVTTVASSGIFSDPNRNDDPEFIVHLVERVSSETARIVAGLPGEA
jgi:predicted helicase